MALLQALAQERGISAAAVVRQLVREEARRVGLKPSLQPAPTGEGLRGDETASENVS